MRIRVAFVALTAFIAGPAMAADMTSGATPLPLPQCIWCGWYVGGNVGGVWGGTWGNDPVAINSFPAGINSVAPLGVFNVFGNPAALSATGTLGQSKAGFGGGGQTGYNWQFSSWVVGLETDIQGVSSKSSFTGSGVAPSPAGPDLTTFSASKTLSYLGTLRARFGVTVTPTLLAYTTGGLAYGGASGSAGFTTVNTSFPPRGLSSTWGTTGSFSSTLAGWTLGGGLEWMFAPGWSARAEYLYYDLGSVSYGIGSSGSVVLPGFIPAGTNWFTNNSTASTHYNGSIARIGLNYQFNVVP